MATWPVWQGSPVATLILCVHVGLWPPWIIVLVLVHVIGVVAMRVIVPIADAHGQTRAALIRRRAGMPTDTSSDGDEATAA
jgi:hypothetical protein